MHGGSSSCLIKPPDVPILCMRVSIVRFATPTMRRHNVITARTTATQYVTHKQRSSARVVQSPTHDAPGSADVLVRPTTAGYDYTRNMS